MYLKVGRALDLKNLSGCFPDIKLSNLKYQDQSTINTGHWVRI